MFVGGLMTPLIRSVPNGHVICQEDFGNSLIINPTKMKKPGIVIALLLVFVSHAHAQKMESKAIMAGGEGGFVIGYGNFDVSDLQVFLPDGFSKPSANHMVIGGEGHAFIQNLVIGGSGLGLVGSSMSNATYQTNFGGGLGTFDFGYLIINKEKVKFFPLLGIGGGSYSVSTSENENISLAQLQTRPSREIGVSSGGMAMQISLRLSLIPALRYDPDENSYGGFMTGLKVGYLFYFPSSEWSYKGGEVHGGPNFGLRGFYASIVIGGSGFRGQK